MVTYTKAAADGKILGRSSDEYLPKTALLRLEEAYWQISVKIKPIHTALDHTNTLG